MFIMETKERMLIALGIIVLSVLMSIYYYPQLPDKIATHWGISGEANGYSSKLFGLAILPVISILIVGLFLVLPILDPMKKNYASFRKYYDTTVIVLVGFFAYLQALSIFWNLGYAFSLNMMLSLAFGVLFFYLGILLGKAKQNWFVGIRTPWTMSNAKVWDKTHKLAGKLYKAVGILTVLAALIFEKGLFISIALVIAVSIAVVVYSYLEYRKIK
jgi:uncharacterized membrane protein